MGLKSFNPYTASRRFMTVLDKSHITKQTPEKSLLEPKKRSGGRNNQGEVSIWHRGGGHKKQYRKIDFRRDKDGVPAKVPTSRSCTMPMATSATSCIRLVLKSARPCQPEKRLTFFLAMP